MLAVTILRLFIQNESPLQVAHWHLFDSQFMPLRSGQECTDLRTLPTAEEVEVVIPADWVSIVNISLPAGFHKLQLNAYPYLIEDHLITSAEQSHVVLIEKQGDKSASFVAIDKQKLASILKEFTALGIQPRRLAPDVLLPSMPIDGWTIVLDAPHAFVKTASDNGFSVEASLDTPPFALLLALNDANAKQSLPSEIRVHAKSSIALENWQNTLLQEKIEVRLTQSQQNWDTARLPSCNLLQGPYTPDSGMSALLTGLKPALVMLIAALSITLLASIGDIGLKSWKKKQLDQDIQQLFTSTFPTVTNIVDAPLQMHRALQELQHGVGVSGEQDVLPLLALIADHGLGKVSVQSIQFNEDALTLVVLAPSESEAKSLSESIMLPGRITVIENMRIADKGVMADLMFKLDGE